MIIAETTQLADAAKPFVNRSRLHEFFITDFSHYDPGLGVHRPVYDKSMPQKAVFLIFQQKGKNYILCTLEFCLNTSHAVCLPQKQNWL